MPHPVLIIGRLPSASSSSLKGQHRVTLNIARNWPGPRSVVTLSKEGSLLRRLLGWRTNHRNLNGIDFEEVSFLRLLCRAARHRHALVTAGYYYGLLACLARIATLGRLQVAHRTGGFVRQERRISNSLGEADGNTLFGVLLEYAVLRLANRILVNSDFYSAQLRQSYPFTQRKTLLLRNGLDDSLMPATPTRSPQEPIPCRLLSVTNLFGKKGVDILVETFRRVKSTQPLHLTIVGDGLSSMRQLIEQTSRDESLRAQGKQLTLLSGLGNAALVQLYRNSHLYLQLSRFDEGPSAVLEAYAHGLPLLLSNRVGTTPEILDSPACTVCPPDPEQASQVLEQLLPRLRFEPTPEPSLDCLRWKTILENAAPHIFAHPAESADAPQPPT